MKGLFLLMSVATALIASGPGGGTAGGGGTGGGGTTLTNAVEVRTLNERVPAGTTFQAKFILTQPHPIGSGFAAMFIDTYAVNGVSIFSPLGDAAAAAVWQNGFLNVNVVSPSGDYGSNLDYPFLTVTMTVPPTMPAGSTLPLQFANTNFIGPTGPIVMTDPKPGVLTVGGSISIHNISPGGGTWPAGTVVRVEGTGFSTATKLTPKVHTSPARYVSPTEMDFTLLDATTTMDMLAVTAQNPDGSQVTYYSYLRGTLINLPSTVLLRHTDPVFQSQTHTSATFNVPALAPGQFAAMAIQNPSTGPATVTLRVQSTGAITSFTLPSGGRIMDEISTLVSATVAAGDSVVVSSTAPVQMLGLIDDEPQGVVTPFLPVF